MKRITLIFLLISLAAVTVMGQDINLQLAVATQALTRTMLEDLDLTGAEIQNILRLQEQFRLTREENTLELNVIKARIAQMLYKPDANTAEVGQLLERASQLRLEQEMAQVEAYQGIRKEMGEDCWSDLMTRAREKTRERQQNQTSTRTGTGSSSGSRSTPAAPSGSGSGSSQSQGTNRR